MCVVIVHKIKCHQYWPESDAIMYGDFKVTMTKHEVIAKYCIRKFIIEKVMKTILCTGVLK